MLEIRNLTKIYRSKTGEQVRALDNVSISFPESGMIFILGKSGSGKSTLLNVMGGLDSYDDGEFIIKGKSSKQFGGSDFDAYRNTFIGFIFQEYNVLDDFTVGANIGLALELQGKKATSERINAILEQVDLVNYAKRKPNELSGGQKQRVAIARALVKEPQIIMADEPTGALDSNTGKQIFDTLKSLSREKLVLVVSHDRDFAERYADRIIELSDGHIVSDVTKHEHESVAISEGVDRINSNIFRIKGGYRLTAADVEMINAYLAKNSSDVLLSGDGRVNDELRSAVGISEKGTTAVFEGTDKEKDYILKQYEKKDSKFIRSRLPIKNALRIGASGLKHKKFRLVMTIFLSLIAFALFGFADTAAGYDKITATFESILDSNVKNASVTLGVRHSYSYTDRDTYTYHERAFMNDEDVEWLRNETNMDFVPVYTGSQYRDGNFSYTSMMSDYQTNAVYTGRMSGLVAMDEDSLARTGFAVTGRLPQAEGEIAITELMYRQFNEYGFVNAAHKESVAAGALTMNQADPNSILGKHITLSGAGNGVIIYGDKSQSADNANTFVIVGVIDTGFDYARYDSFLPEDTDGNVPTVKEEENALTEMVLMNELSSELGYGFHALGFVTRETVDAFAASNLLSTRELGRPMNAWNREMYLAVKMPEGMTDESVGPMGSSESKIQTVADSEALASLKVTWLDGTKRTTLGANEVVISSNYVKKLLPSSVTMTLDADTVKTVVTNAYGSEGWNMTSPTQSYRTRLEIAAAVHYINETMNGIHDQETIQMMFNYAYDQGDPTLFVGDKKEFVRTRWIEKWVNESDYGWTPAVPQTGTYKSFYEIPWETREVVSDFYLALFGVSLPNTFSAEAEAWIISSIYQDAANLLNQTSEEAPEYSLSASTVSNLLGYIEAEKTVFQMRLWENQAFVDLMLSYNEGSYLSKTQWNNLETEEQKRQYAADFYRGWYLSNFDLGYEKNAFGGKSGKELNAEAETIYQELIDIDLKELASQIGFEHREMDYMTGDDTSKGTLSYTIVGYYDADAYPYGNMIVSDTLTETYEAWYAEVSEEVGYHEEIAEHEAGLWSFAIAPMTTDHDTLLKLVEMGYDETGDYRFEMQNAVMNTLSSFNEFIEVGAKIFLYVGIGFAVFSALLLMNFIATSISYKKREIGVLRAVGARSSDVFKIFFSEALVIAAINFILSMAAVITAISFANNWMRSSGINITLLTFGIRQFILMLLVSVGVALLASFLPVYHIARRKPIDAIRDK